MMEPLPPAPIPPECRIAAVDAIAGFDITVAEAAVGAISAAPVPDQVRVYVGWCQRSQDGKLRPFWDARQHLSQPQYP